MEERSFAQRNKRVHLQELTDVAASRSRDEADGGQSEARALEAVTREVSEAELRAFQDAGWRFRMRSPGDSPVSAAESKVFVKSGGRLALGTDRLTLQFTEEVSEEQAKETLAPYGVRVVERLKFAPGLFQVALTSEARGDIIDVANELANSGRVAFAEPVLIEAAGPRSS
jgi:hypothetical protein